MTSAFRSIRPIAIIGAGEHARVVAAICRAAGLTVAGFIGTAASRGEALLGDDRLLTDGDFLRSYDLVPGIGDQAARHRTALGALAAGARFADVRHPSAIVCESAQIDEGSVLCPGAIINIGARIGRFCIINTRASIDHDCVLEDAVQIGPGAVLCGAARCGEEVFVGAGAIILPGRELGARSIAGAGAVVTRNVAAGVVVVGNPARPRN